MSAEVVSLTAGWLLLITSAMVMKAYSPRKKWSNTGQGWLGFAIFLSFTGLLLNTLWWQILGNLLPTWGWVDITTFRNVGLYLDGALKGVATVAAVCHLVAIRLMLTEPDRSTWWWFEMPWYPKRRACLKALADMLRKKDSDQ